MENENGFGEKINKALDDVKVYVNLRLRLIQLNMAEKISVALSTIITSSISYTFYILFFLFGSFALAFWLGDVFENLAIGFGIIAAAYLIIAFIFGVAFKKQIRKKLTDSFIGNFANEQENENNEQGD